MMCLPRGKLKRPGDQHHRTGRDRNTARQQRPPHLDRRQRNAQRKDGHSEHGPNEEIPRPHACDQPIEARLACRAYGLAVAPQHRDQGRQHHRHHHHDPHAEERRCGSRPRLPGHPHPCHGQRPTAGHRHPTHRRHRPAPSNRCCRADHEQQRRDAEEGSRRRSLRSDASEISDPRWCYDTHDFAQRLSYSSWRRHHMPVSLRPLGARSSH